MIPAPIIVTATLGAADFAWFDRQRRLYFPPERNRLAAHLTLFHALPPSCADELRHRLAAICAAAAPVARVRGLINLGRGVAYRIESEGLAAIRAELASVFHGLLTSQDRSGFRPHVTIQNKATPAEARRLLATLRTDFESRPVAIAGLACHWYRGGPWEPLASYRFRGSVA